MRIVRQTETELVIRRRPWVAWSGGLVIVAVTAVITFSAWLAPALVCAERRCTFRENPWTIRTFAAADLDAEGEVNTNRPRLARLILLIRGERVIFDYRNDTIATIDRIVERVHEYTKDTRGELVVGEKGDLNRALLSLAAAIVGALFLASRGKYSSLRFDKVKNELTVTSGGIFQLGRRKLPLSDARRLRVDAKRAEHTTTYTLVLELANGEPVIVGEYLLEQSAHEAEVKRAISGFLAG